MFRSSYLRSFDVRYLPAAEEDETHPDHSHVVPALNFWGFMQIRFSYACAHYERWTSKYSSHRELFSLPFLPFLPLYIINIRPLSATLHLLDFFTICPYCLERTGVKLYPRVMKLSESVLGRSG
jgi:hypothetical protein